MLRVKDRIIEYKVGDMVNLSPNELSKICVLVHLVTDDIAKSAYEYAKKIDIEERNIEKGVEQKSHWTAYNATTDLGRYQYFTLTNPYFLAF